MTCILGIVCENRKKLVMACDSLILGEDYVFKNHEDKIYYAGDFLLGGAGNSHAIEEAVRLFENEPSKTLKNAYEKLKKFNEELNCEKGDDETQVQFLLGGNDRGKMALYYHDCADIPSYDTYSTGLGSEKINYHFLDTFYTRNIKLKEAILLSLECLDYLEKMNGIGSPFYVHYINGIDGKPRKLDEKTLLAFQEIVNERKQRIKTLDDELINKANKISLGSK